MTATSLPWMLIGWTIAAVLALMYAGAAVQSWSEWRPDYTAPIAVVLALFWPAWVAATWIRTVKELP